jgi:hypothetical protein
MASQASINKKKYFINNGEITGPLKKLLLREFKLPSETYIGPMMGTKSTNGTVHPMDNGKVLKLMISKHNDQGDFKNEVQVGQTPGIEAVGTKIYQNTYFEIKGYYIGAYIMDNLLTGTNGRLMSLHQYWVKHYRNSCPDDKNKAAKMYTKLIYDFYKITKGWHADLHTENIQVVTDANGKLRHMKVIDYGSHMKFKSNISHMTCLDQILDQIQKEFTNLPSAGQNVYWPEAGPHKMPPRGRGQYVISNASVLRGSLHPMYASSKLRGLSSKNVSKFSPNRVSIKKRVYNYSVQLGKSAYNIGRRVYSYVRPRPKASTSPRPKSLSPKQILKSRNKVLKTPQGAVRISKKTERGRPIFRGPRGGHFVIDANNKKNYKRPKAFL